LSNLIAIKCRGGKSQKAAETDRLARRRLAQRQLEIRLEATSPHLIHLLLISLSHVTPPATQNPCGNSFMTSEGVCTTKSSLSSYLQYGLLSCRLPDTVCHGRPEIIFSSGFISSSFTLTGPSSRPLSKLTHELLRFKCIYRPLDVRHHLTISPSTDPKKNKSMCSHSRPCTGLEPIDDPRDICAASDGVHFTSHFSATI
jgi:hypothetical protein